MRGQLRRLSTHSRLSCLRRAHGNYVSEAVTRQAFSDFRDEEHHCLSKHVRERFFLAQLAPCRAPS